MKNILPKKGQKVTILPNNAGAPAGTFTLTANSTQSGGYTYLQLGASRWSLLAHEFKVGGLSKDDLKEQIQELKIEIKDVETRLAFIEETGQEEYNETEYKVWSILKEFDNPKLSQLEKAKAIATLVDG